MWPMIEAAVVLQQEMREAVAKDAEAFEGYMQARRLPRDTDEQKETRLTAIREASIQAAKVPLYVAEKALKIMGLAIKAAELGNVNAISDAGAAAGLAHAGLKGADLNVRINLLGLEDEPEPTRMLEELRALDKKAQDLDENIKKILTERGGLGLS
jgi:formiminotetrahydrofolate cyclodeaminase